MKFRRTGRHTTPSQVEKVAEKAGKAAPAMAISAGALMAAPHGHSAVPATHGTVATQSVTSKAVQSALSKAGPVTARLDSEVRPAQQQDRSYTVQSGDTLSSIAQQFYGKSADWAWLDHVNRSKVQNANLIYPGQALNVPADPPANYTLPASTTPATSTTSSTSGVSNGDGDGSQAAPAAGSGAEGGSQAAGVPASSSAAAAGVTASGSYTCSGLEALWQQAGGSAAEAVVAASIAMAESGGNPNAVSPTADYGLWQINATSHGAQATFDPLANAQAAVSISSNGADWTPWTTFVTGAYSGRC
jgi:LysM repeat protein